MLKKKLLIILSILFIDFGLNSNLSCAAAGHGPLDERFDAKLYMSVSPQDLRNVGSDYECAICCRMIRTDDINLLCQANCQAKHTARPHIYHKECLLLWIRSKGKVENIVCPLCRGEMAVMCEYIPNTK